MLEPPGPPLTTLDEKDRAMAETNIPEWIVKWAALHLARLCLAASAALSRLARKLALWAAP